MKKNEKNGISGVDSSYDSWSYDRNGGVNSFSRQRENQDYCTVKRNGINRAVSDL